MSRSAEIMLDFADGRYLFRLAWAQLIELQEKCDAGPNVIFVRLADETWNVQYIGEVIRLGLIGGGVQAVKAKKLVERYVEAFPVRDHLPLAIQILGAALIGAPDEKLGEAESRERPNGSTISPTANSGSGESTVSVQ